MGGSGVLNMEMCYYHQIQFTNEDILSRFPMDLLKIVGSFNNLGSSTLQKLLSPSQVKTWNNLYIC